MTERERRALIRQVIDAIRDVLNSWGVDEDEVLAEIRPAVEAAVENHTEVR